MTEYILKDGDFISWKRDDGSIANYKLYLGSLIQQNNKTKDVSH